MKDRTKSVENSQKSETAIHGEKGAKLAKCTKNLGQPIGCPRQMRDEKGVKSSLEWH
jgi:hypothetical protein